MFLEDCPKQLAAIKAAVDQREPQLIRSTAHALKGAASNLSFRAATKDEAKTLRRGGDSLGLEAFVWSSIYREGDVSLDVLSERTSLSLAELLPLVESLVTSGKVERSGSAGADRLRSSQLVLGFDDPAGWESSVLDHFTALVQTVMRKLAIDDRLQLALHAARAGAGAR